MSHTDWSHECFVLTRHTDTHARLLHATCSIIDRASIATLSEVEFVLHFAVVRHDRNADWARVTGRCLPSRTARTEGGCVEV